MTTKLASMRLVCPGCGCFGSIETFANDADARAVASLLGQLAPEVANAMQRYLRMFAPAKHALTWRKGRKVLDELVPLVTAGSIRRNGRDWPAPAAAWISAVDAMLGNRNLQLPLSGHGYLLQIIAGEADKAEGQAENERELQRRGGPRAKASGGQPSVSDLRGAIDGMDETIQRAHVRTATAMLVAHATQIRTAYRQELSDDEARTVLKQFAPAVIDAAIDQWHRSRK